MRQIDIFKTLQERYLIQLKDEQREIRNQLIDSIALWVNERFVEVQQEDDIVFMLPPLDSN